MSNWVTCPKCAGIGSIRPDGNKQVCPTCKGGRWVKAEKPAAPVKETDND